MNEKNSFFEVMNIFLKILNLLIIYLHQILLKTKKKKLFQNVYK